MPILATRYGRALTDGALAIVDADPTPGAGRLAVRAGTDVLPIAPRALGTIVRRAGERIDHAELAFVGDHLVELPSGHDLEARRRRHRDKLVLAERLAALCTADRCTQAIADELVGINADPAELDAILEAQAYRLAHWSVAGSQLSYRRFFDVSTLVAIRNEKPDVLEATHHRILALIADGAIDGVRVDHVDGLRDPGGYLCALRERAPAAWIVVEKIKAVDEVLPAWPVDGTTGYGFMEHVGGLFVDADAEAKLTTLYESMTGEAWQPVLASRRARLEVMTDALHSELARLAELAARACAASPACRDYTRAEIETALAEILAGYPIYRTYLPSGGEVDRARIATAVAAARDARPELDRDLLVFLEAALAFEVPSAGELAYSAQQVTGAITAKGDEDTLLYRQVRLLARCEVGAALDRFAYPAAAVHRALAAGPPRSLLALSTHDSKRSEDVRARIAVISERPDAWADAVWRWRGRGDRYWTVAPDRTLEYALWQTLVGAWPLPLDRAKAYARKAAREARIRTSWRRPDAPFEAAVDRWCDGVYADAELVADVARFASELAPYGDLGSLAQLVIKLAAPGVPDSYQGGELRDDSLVDPDNRRAVDLALRRDRLRWIVDATPAAVLATGELGTAKLWTIRRSLGLRRRQPELFAGEYLALAATGPHAHRVFAFARGDALVAVVPRLAVRADGWRATTLSVPAGTWRDVLADRTVSGGAHLVAKLWRGFPVALLART